MHGDLTLGVAVLQLLNPEQAAMAFIESFPWYPDLLAIAAILAARYEDRAPGGAKESDILKQQVTDLPLSRSVGVHSINRSQEIERAQQVKDCKRRGVSLPTLTCKEVEEQLGGSTQPGVPTATAVRHPSQGRARSTTPSQHSVGPFRPVCAPTSPFHVLSQLETARDKHVPRAVAFSGSTGRPAADGPEVTSATESQNAAHAEAAVPSQHASACPSPDPPRAADLQSSHHFVAGETATRLGLGSKLEEHVHWHVKHEAIGAQQDRMHLVGPGSLGPNCAGLDAQDSGGLPTSRTGSTQDAFDPAMPFQAHSTAHRSAAQPPLPSRGLGGGLVRINSNRRSGSLDTVVAEAARASIRGGQARFCAQKVPPTEGPQGTSQEVGAGVGAFIEHRSASLQLNQLDVPAPSQGPGAPRRTSFDCGAGPYAAIRLQCMAGSQDLYAGAGRAGEPVSGPQQRPWERRGPVGGNRYARLANGRGPQDANSRLVVGSSPEAADPHAELLHLWQAGKSHVTSVLQPTQQPGASGTTVTEGEPLPFLAWTRMPALAPDGARKHESESGRKGLSGSNAPAGHEAAFEGANPNGDRVAAPSRAPGNAASSFASLSLLPFDTKRRRSPSPTQSLSESDVWNVGLDEQTDGNLRSVHSADVAASRAKQDWGLSGVHNGSGLATFQAGLTGYASQLRGASQVSALSHALSKCKDSSEVGDGGVAALVGANRKASIAEVFPAGDTGRHPIGTLRSLTAAGLLYRRASLESD